MDVEGRYLLCRQSRWCVRCLRPRPHVSCSEESCIKCDRNHNSLLHFPNYDAFQAADAKASGAVKKQSARQSQQSSAQKLSNQATVQHICNQSVPEHSASGAMMPDSTNDVTQSHYNFNSTYTWLATAVVTVRNEVGDETFIRVLLDSGSQVSIISSKAMALLKWKTMKTNLQVSGVNGDVTQITRAVQMQIGSRDGAGFKCNIVAAVHKKLVQKHPAIAT